LAGLVKKMFGEELEKEDTWRLRYSELEGVPLRDWPEEAVNYAVNDAVWTYNCHLFRTRSDPPYPDEWLQVRTDLAFQAMHCWGQEYRQSKVIALDLELQEKIYGPGLRDGLDEELAKPDPEDMSLEAYLITHKVLRRSGSKNTVEINRRVWEHFTGLRWNPEWDIRWVEKKRVRDKETKEWSELFYSEPEEGAVSAETLDHARVITSELVPLTDKEAIKTDKDTLLLTDDKVLHKLQERSAIHKGLNDFVPKLLPLTHPRFNALVATGRSSCSKHNAQQMPRAGDFRGCLVARPGWVVLWVDYSAIELCTLAESHYEELGRSALGDLLKDGIDPHLWMAVAILELEGLEITYEEALEAKRNKTHPLYQRVKDARQMSKAADFGFPGGMGYRKFTVYARGSWGVDISTAKSKWLKELWLQKFPEMTEHFKIVGAMGDNHSYTLPKSGRTRGGLGFCDGCNTKFQGPASDLNKDAFWEVFWATRQPPTWQPTVYQSPVHVPGWSNLLSGSKQINFVHDEQVLEAPGSWDLMGVPKADQPEVSAPEAILDVVEQTMIKVGERWLKHVPVLVEGTYSDCWGK
jgi:hypothetical protein